MKLTELIPSAQRKLFVYGEAGTGKTVFACSFPTPLYVFDFDGKISSAAAYYDGAEQAKGIDFDLYVKSPDATKGVPYERFDKKLTELEQASVTDFPYRTVVVDSTTLFAETMLSEVVRRNPGLQRPKTNLVQATCMADYGIFAQLFHNTLLRLLSLPANLVMTGHIQTEKDDLTGAITHDPLLPGRRAPKLIPILFEEVYRAYTETKDGRISYLAQTQSLPQYKARSQIRGLPAVIPLTYAELDKKR